VHLDLHQQNTPQQQMIPSATISDKHPSRERQTRQTQEIWKLAFQVLTIKVQKIDEAQR